MSDSDDTDVLLLIPPDFFLINETLTECNCSFTLESEICATPNHIFNSMLNNYSYLAPKQRSELRAINARLSQIEKNNSISDCSNVSNWPHARIRDGFAIEAAGTEHCSPVDKFTHSTPKVVPVVRPDDTILSEIDHFLEDNSKKSDLLGIKAIRSLKFSSENMNNKEINSLPSLTNAHWQPQNTEDNYELISLSEIWGRDKANENFVLQEERMRRQHCEKIIQELQSKLLDSQQKVSIALEIDKTKDMAIKKTHDDNSNLRTIIQKMEEQIGMLEERNCVENQQLLCENSELKTRIGVIESELSKSVKLTANLQDKNELLERKISSLMKASNEVGDIYKKQLQDMEIRLSNSQRSEKLLAQEVVDLKKAIAKSEADFENVEALKNGYEKQLGLLQEEIEIVRKQQQSSAEKYREEKNRADTLENQKISCQSSIKELELREVNFSKEIENQRSALKTHYQKQLEQVVAQKLKEFQSQLDSVEANLKSEAKQRERVLATRAIKQIEMINEKNEQEIHLLQEKHNEEIELYKIQINNATKTIEELEDKLIVYKTRRSELAEKLHSIMEVQWQKALEILTSPQNKDSLTSMHIEKHDSDKLDQVRNDDNQDPENENFETPQRSKEHDPNAINDKLHAYIEMLLEKSPRDLQNLDEILRMPKNPSLDSSKQGVGHTNNDKSLRHSTKRPWK